MGKKGFRQLQKKKGAANATQWHLRNPTCAQVQKKMQEGIENTWPLWLENRAG